MRPPQFKRLIVDDFQSQKDWITALFQPLNTFMEETQLALTNNLTLSDNFNGSIVTLTLTSVPSLESPYKIAWDSKRGIPKAVLVGRVALTDNKDFTASAAYGINWKYDSGYIYIVQFFGVTPSDTSKYNVNFVILGG